MAKVNGTWPQCAAKEGLAFKGVHCHASATLTQESRRSSLSTKTSWMPFRKQYPCARSVTPSTHFGVRRSCTEPAPAVAKIRPQRRSVVLMTDRARGQNCCARTGDGRQDRPLLPKPTPQRDNRQQQRVRCAPPPNSSTHAHMKRNLALRAFFPTCTKRVTRIVLNWLDQG